MDHEKIPVLLSIPHGGTEHPPELKDIISITARDLFDDSDPFVIKIYDLGCMVQHVTYTNIARTFVDLNRSPQDMPPVNPDGLIKSTTAYQQPIYRRHCEPDAALRELLINKYYYPYHQEIQESIKELDLELCLDCHSMAEFAPNISPDRLDSQRPMLCLSNQDGKTSSSEMINLLADCASSSFDIDRQDIRINDPFHGGYITKKYGNNPTPWIQVEINRCLYLDERWFDSDKLIVKESRLRELNKMFGKTLEMFFEKRKQ